MITEDDELRELRAVHTPQKRTFIGIGPGDDAQSEQFRARAHKYLAVPECSKCRTAYPCEPARIMDLCGVPKPDPVAYRDDQGFMVCATDFGSHVISWRGQWLDGSFASVDEALKSGRQQICATALNISP